MTHIIMTVSIMTVSIMTVSIMTVSIMTVRIMTVSMMTVSIMTVSKTIKKRNTQDKQQSESGAVLPTVVYSELRVFYCYAECHYAESHCSECRGALKRLDEDQLSSLFV
jgi:hypothetical protein